MASLLMGGGIDKSLSDGARKELIQVLRDRYGKVTRVEKSMILNEFVALTGFHWKHAIQVLARGLDAPGPEPKARFRLYDEAVSLPRWLKDPTSEKGQRTEMALVRYLSRMCHRPTPFGLFAGHSKGHMSETTRLCVTARDKYRRTTRLDFNYLSGLVAELQKDYGLRESLVYRPNSSLYRFAGRLRYAETQVKEGNRSIHLVALSEDEYLCNVLEAARGGAYLKDLATVLIDEDLTLEDAWEFLHELVDNQVIVPDLEPATTGPEPLPALVEALRRVTSTMPLAEVLAQVGHQLEELDAGGLGNLPEPYLDIAKRLGELPGKVERSKLWQVDLFKSAPEASLGRNFQESVEEAVELLQKLAPPREEDKFKDFKEAFLKRFEQRWVRLTEVLDPESGLGFSGTKGNTVLGVPLLEGLLLRPSRGGSGATPGLNHRETWLLRRLLELHTKESTELVLTEEDVKSLTTEGKHPLPTSFAMMVEVSANSAEALDKGNFRAFLHAAHGPTAARLLGRFCHGDSELCEEVIRHLEAEEGTRPEVVFAEIAHLPFGRLGNVLARPLLRNYEIPYLGASGMDSEHCIDIQDLYVGVVNDRVKLWSKRLNREVVPRLSSAATYQSRATDMFRFLASTQDQEPGSWAGWTWGRLATEPFLPRVVHSRWVLSRATWTVKQSQLTPVRIATSPVERFQSVQGLRNELKLPRHMLLADGDNELPIDLENPLSVETLWALVKKREGFQLVEDYPGGQGLVVEGPEGMFTHELILPFLNTRDVPQPIFQPPILEDAPVLHAPGSNWLYAKLYSGQATLDQLLTGIIEPLVKEVLAEGDADRWFFIRYGDPDPHLRLRFHGEPTQLWQKVLPRLQSTLEPILKDGWLWKVLLDSYEPEIGRYGGQDNLARSELLFQVDSEAILKIMQLYPGDEGTNARWRLALISVDEYYACMEWSLEDRLRIAEKQRDMYAPEFSATSGHSVHQLGRKFRSEQKELGFLLDLSKNDQHPLLPGIVALKARTSRLRPLFQEMVQLKAKGVLTHPIEVLMASYIHMSVNRFLRSAQRAQEFVIYDFLVRLYRSRLARSRQTPSPQIVG